MSEIQVNNFQPIIQNNIVVNVPELLRSNVPLSKVRDTVEILQKIHSKLEASYKRGIYKQDVPVLLVEAPQTLSNLKMNIDKYLQFAFRTSSKDSTLLSLQLISDYAVGLQISELQRDKMYNGVNFDIVALEVSKMLKNYDLNGSLLAKLVNDCKSMKGEENLNDAL